MPRMAGLQARPLTILSGLSYVAYGGDGYGVSSPFDQASVSVNILVLDRACDDQDYVDYWHPQTEKTLRW
jgi:hypothetical protein